VNGIISSQLHFYVKGRYYMPSEWNDFFSNRIITKSSSGKKELEFN